MTADIYEPFWEFHATCDGQPQKKLEAADEMTARPESTADRII
jgi:hypothetical protein